MRARLGSLYNRRVDDGLYLDVLRNLLQCMDRCAPEHRFAWAITNVLPEYWYHWGEEYGHKGVHSFMEKFRKTVKEIVVAGKEYQRTFLVYYGGERNEPELRESAQLQTGGPGPTPYSWVVGKGQRRIQLHEADTLGKMSSRVLLLVTQDAEDEPTDSPMEISRWRDLIGDDYMGDIKEGVVYGIIDSSTSTEQGWVIDADKVIQIGLDYYKLRPVPLLTYFAETYHFPHTTGMYIQTVRDEHELDPLPEHNADWLILGTKNGEDYEPAIAISSNLGFNSETMLMQVFTARKDLDNIKAFWRQSVSKRMPLGTFLQRMEPAPNSEPPKA